MQVALAQEPYQIERPHWLCIWRNYGITRNKAEAKELLEMIVTRPHVTTLLHLDFFEDVSLSDDPELFQKAHDWLTQ